MGYFERWRKGRKEKGRGECKRKGGGRKLVVGGVRSEADKQRKGVK